MYKAKMAGESLPNLTTLDLDAPISDDGTTKLGDMLLKCQPSSDIEADLEQLIYTAHRVLATLKERDRKIVSAYFGIDADYEMPTDIIAARFDLTNVRVCQIVKGAIQKMRESI